MISIKNLTFTLPHKTCFEGFNAQLHPGARIALIGQNGSGKSTLLKILAGEVIPSEGTIAMPEVTIGYVPQIIENHPHLSGGERFQKALTDALRTDPELLLLDEPTNHLDCDNRKSLMRMLQSYRGIVIIASHDVELLKDCIDTLWHFDQGRISVFEGSYDDYLRERQIKHHQIEAELANLSRAKKKTHQGLMHEQSRAKKSSARGKKFIENRKWPTVRSHTKAGRANETAGRKQKAISVKRQELNEKLSETRLPEIIMPTFSLKVADIRDRVLVSIRDGRIGYRVIPAKAGIQEHNFAKRQNDLKQKSHHPSDGKMFDLDPCLGRDDKFCNILTNINLSLSSTSRVSITGKNGSGKSTLVKAILDHSETSRSGDWDTPKYKDIGYLDQHYSFLHCEVNTSAQLSNLASLDCRVANAPRNDVLTLLTSTRPDWSHAEARKHLNDFLFRKNEEVSADITTLSGGEKARLSLALIAAKTPKLLILDEITNNIDLETRDHVIQVLKNYPGAMIVISHDQGFLDEIGVEEEYEVNAGTLRVPRT